MKGDESVYITKETTYCNLLCFGSRDFELKISNFRKGYVLNCSAVR